MWGIVCIIQDFTSSLLDLKPPFRGHHTHYIRHRVLDCIFVLTPTLSMIHQPLYVWYHIKYMWDILSTIFMTSYSLCMTPQPSVLITPHSAYVWHHLHYRKQHILSITSSYNLYDFTSTSGMTSHSLYQICTHCIFVITLSPLISHPLLYENTPTICIISYALYITSYPLIMSSHYCTYDSKTLTYEPPQYAVQNIHYPCDITVTRLCRHTHSLYDITPTIFYIISTLFLSPHPLYWYHTNSISEISSSICGDIISIVYSNIFTIFFPSQPLYLCLTPTLSMISHPLYIWHCTHYMFNIRYTI